jgi:hypothetical protein
MKKVSPRRRSNEDFEVAAAKIVSKVVIFQSLPLPGQDVGSA